MDKMLPERLLKVRKEAWGSQQGAADALSISVKSWQNYELGKSVPGGDVFEGLVNHGFNANWLLTGEGPMRWEMYVQHPGRVVREESACYRESECLSGDFALVPRYEVEASAGSGAEVGSEQIVDHLAFKRPWLKSLGLQADQLALITARGDSMQPTIKDGSLLLVDLTKREQIQDGIYVLRMDDMLMAKRLQRLLDGGVLVQSDNRIYKEIKAEPHQVALLNVVGKVVWVGSMI
jgi:phage repressor protein C with HTH and peptisase S24 domain